MWKVVEALANAGPAFEKLSSLGGIGLRRRDVEQPQGYLVVDPGLHSGLHIQRYRRILEKLRDRGFSKGNELGGES